ncbi:MAG: hypothetical protein QM696_02630 [Steroidobacteraceae bacterium]
MRHQMRRQGLGCRRRHQLNLAAHNFLYQGPRLRRPLRVLRQFSMHYALVGLACLGCHFQHLAQFLRCGQVCKFQHLRLNAGNGGIQFLRLQVRVAFLPPLLQPSQARF